MRITDIQGISPTNYKKGTLIYNKYRYIDLIIMISSFIWGFLWIILLFFVFSPSIISFVGLVVIIPVIGFMIVQPISNYHNNLEYLMLLIKFKKKYKFFTSIVLKEKR